MTERREERRKQLLDEVKGKTGYWKLNKETLGGSLWRTPLEYVMGVS